jgi:GNAT superfamily N-acetyltransferase
VVDIRPMQPADVAAADAMGYAVMYGGEAPDEREPALVRRAQRRIAHLQATDPGGAWVAEAGGRIVGLSLALVREGIWGLSLFGVAQAHQGRGIGRRLLEAAFAHGADARGHLILSSESPAAMRLYARLGLDLRPCVSAAGVIDPLRRPAAAGHVDAGRDGVALADAIGRAVRGAGHGRDLPVILEDARARLILHEDRAFAVLRDARVILLAALDDDAAIRVLQGALARVPPGATAGVEFMTAGQDWAVRACLDAGLALSPDGPLFCAGELGPLRPYLPSGAYL